MLFAMAALEKLRMLQFDVNTAFLYDKKKIFGSNYQKDFDPKKNVSLNFVSYYMA